MSGLVLAAAEPTEVGQAWSGPTRDHRPAALGPQLSGAHLDHLEHFDGRVLEAVFPQEGADGVNRLVHLSQELAVGLEEVTDELVEVPGRGLVQERGLQRTQVGPGGEGLAANAQAPPLGFP